MGSRPHRPLVPPSSLSSSLSHHPPTLQDPQILLTPFGSCCNPPFQQFLSAVLGSRHSHLPRGHSGKTAPKFGWDGSDPFSSLVSPSLQLLVPSHNNPPAAGGKLESGDPWVEGNSGLAVAWKQLSSLRVRQKKKKKKGPAVPDIPQITAETGKKEKPCPRMQGDKQPVWIQRSILWSGLQASFGLCLHPWVA